MSNNYWQWQATVSVSSTSCLVIARNRRRRRSTTVLMVSNIHVALLSCPTATDRLFPSERYLTNFEIKFLN
jgi:hypothetical protein